MVCVTLSSFTSVTVQAVEAFTKCTLIVGVCQVPLFPLLMSIRQSSRCSLFLSLSSEWVGKPGHPALMRRLLNSGNVAQACPSGSDGQTEGTTDDQDPVTRSLDPLISKDSGGPTRGNLH